jgi:hypothetical protein
MRGRRFRRHRVRCFRFRPPVLCLEEPSMKSRLLAAVLTAGLMCISSQANAAGLLSIFGGGYGYGGGCGCDNACGCDAAPACGCDRGCGHHRCGRGCHTRCHRGCGCNNVCGCDAVAPSCAAPAPTCGCENTCGCDRGCGRCHRGCGCRERCHRGCGRCHRGCGCQNTCGCDAAPACGYDGGMGYGGKM